MKYTDAWLIYWKKNNTETQLLPSTSIDIRPPWWRASRSGFNDMKGLKLFFTGGRISPDPDEELYAAPHPLRKVRFVSNKFTMTGDLRRSRLICLRHLLRRALLLVLFSWRLIFQDVRGNRG